MEHVRLQKYIARAGGPSRRASEEAIRAGRVRVNGEVVAELGTKVTPGIDRVELDGVLLELPVEQVVIMLNKPAGYLSAMSDDHGGKCVSELVPLGEYVGLYPVGRLDQETTGLLLFTNDGELGNDLIHPRHHVPKTYRAWVKGSIGRNALEQLRQGVMLDDGPTLPAEVELIERDDKRSLIQITIYEGRNRQIRRMGKAVNHPVEQLERISLGPLQLGDLKRGSWRLLSDEEEQALRAAIEHSRDRIAK